MIFSSVLRFLIHPYVPLLKPVWCLFFVGSRKCAYPTDIELISDRVNLHLFPPVSPNFPTPRRTHNLSQPSQLSASALNHLATVTRSRESKVFPPAMIDSVLNYSIKCTDAFSLRMASFKGKDKCSTLFLDLASYLCVPL